MNEVSIFLTMGMEMTINSIIPPFWPVLIRFQNSYLKSEYIIIISNLGICKPIRIIGNVCDNGLVFDIILI